jgi:hypothetical protein
MRDSIATCAGRAVAIPLGKAQIQDWILADSEGKHVRIDAPDDGFPGRFLLDGHQG